MSRDENRTNEETINTEDVASVSIGGDASGEGSSGDAEPREGANGEGLSGDGGLREVPPNAKDEFIRRSFWDPDKINAEQITNSFDKYNKSISDQGKAFWLFLLIVYIAYFIVAAQLLCLVFDSDNIASLKDLSPSALSFWLIVIQKLSFLAVILSLGIPLVKLFTFIISSMLESKERQIVRFMNSVKFAHILKYKGTIVDYKENNRPLWDKEKNDAFQVFDDLSLLLSKIEKSDLINIVKQIAKTVKGGV